MIETNVIQQSAINLEQKWNRQNLSDVWHQLKNAVKLNNKSNCDVIQTRWHWCSVCWTSAPAGHVAKCSGYERCVCHWTVICQQLSARCKHHSQQCQWITWSDELLSHTVAVMTLKYFAHAADIIRKKKLQLFGPIVNMPDNRRLKTLWFGMVNGDCHHERPSLRCIDDSLWWCNKSLKEASLITSNRIDWRSSRLVPMI